MDSPLVSVVIPCYNASAYLADCIRSVLEQEVACEIILVDDGSTDDSLEQARALLRNHPASLVIGALRNQGPAVARNLGLQMAHGKYVGFLDADDQYAPDFVRRAVPVMESDPAVVALYCQIELVDAHRSVEPWQREVIEQNLPSNLIVRTETARQIGGFPTHRAFRGRAAGEDYAFRCQLLVHGKMVLIPRPLCKYRVRPGSHFDFFLDRALLQAGHIEFTQRSPEEMDGSWDEATRQYQESVLQRAVARSIGLLETATDAGAKFFSLSQQLESVDGALHSLEGFVLYWAARNWPVHGQVVTTGGFNGRSTCWLAAGCGEGRRGKVVAFDHRQRFAEHRPGLSLTDSHSVENRSPLHSLQRNLQKHGLAEWVTIHPGTSADAMTWWAESIRLLFLAADQGAETMAQAFLLWTRFVPRHGLVVFHHVGLQPDVTKLWNELSTQHGAWRALGRFHTLGILERVGGSVEI